MSEAEAAEIKSVRAVLKELDPQIILQDHAGYLAEHIKHVIAEARAETAAIAERVEEADQLWGLQHRREIEAIQRWREEDPEGRELKMPDYGRLLDWLWAKAHKADEAIELLREHRRLAAMGGCGRNRKAITDFLDDLGKEAVARGTL